MALHLNHIDIIRHAYIAVGHQTAFLLYKDFHDIILIMGMFILERRRLNIEMPEGV